MRLAVFGGVGDDAERADFAVGLLWPHSEVAVRLADGTNQLGIRTRCDAAGLQVKLRLVGEILPEVLQHHTYHLVDYNLVDYTTTQQTTPQTVARAAICGVITVCLWSPSARRSPDVAGDAPRQLSDIRFVSLCLSVWLVEVWPISSLSPAVRNASSNA